LNLPKTQSPLNGSAGNSGWFIESEWRLRFVVGGASFFVGHLESVSKQRTGSDAVSTGQG
jgi:hypothetical protein